jgi:cytoskeleton protein RodZ
MEPNTIMENAIEAPSFSLGQKLTRARKALNMSVDQIASELRLTTSIIKKIEDDNTENSPAPTFMRGYIRSYARIVDISDEEVTEAFTQLGISPISIPSIVKQVPKKSSNRQIPAAIAAAVLGFLISVISLFWLTHPSTAKPSYLNPLQGSVKKSSIKKELITPHPTSKSIPSNATMAAALPEAGPKS